MAKSRRLNQFDITKVESWTAPKKIDGPDPRILTMPNVPDSLHGLAPRTVVGSTTWNHMRKRCYYEANYTCEACGKDLRDAICHAHELYSYNYETNEAKFERCVCLCPQCHLLGIHTGRALSLYRKGHVMYKEKQLLEGAEHTFKLISEWNEGHPDEEPLRAYSTFVSYVDEPRLREPMLDLIEKYNMKFYSPIPDKKDFGSWKIFIGNKWHNSPYSSREEWQARMERNNKTQVITNPLSGGVFDEIESIIKQGEDNEEI